MRRWLPAWWVLAITALGASPVRAVVLDDRGEMRLGMRAYTSVRIGTQTEGDTDDPLSFPHSGDGHVRQNRYFLEVKFDHDFLRLATTTKGAAWLLGWFHPNRLSYSLQYRGEGEGIYDYGPSEFSNQADQLRRIRLDIPEIPGVLSPKLPEKYIDERISRLNRIARQRHRLFLAYLDIEKGPVFIRVGRQILAWGETDVFRLLDNINPLDDSFGGFFIALDERRLPLNMIRSSYQIGSVGPVHDAFLEGFVAQGNQVATHPGIPQGSPWEPGGLGYPNPALSTVPDVPATGEVRGGARLVFTSADVTYTLAHYYTYLDVPGVRFTLPGAVKLPGETTAINFPRFGNPILASQEFPRVGISGASLTFPVPSYYTIVRSEAAFFQGEPMNRQGSGNSADAVGVPGSAAFRRLQSQNNTEGGLDPFVYPGFLDLARQNKVVGGVLQRNTFNMAIGLDVNRYVRWLNPQQTFFITTQFFYKHVFDSPHDLVLPVIYDNHAVASSIPIIGAGCGPPSARRACNLEPRLFHLDDDRFLQTLQISTSYSGGRIVPSFAIFYDWQGVIVEQPAVAFVRDPFRVIMDYTRIDGPPTGQLGTVRDRDNVRFQMEYVF
jgi:uncharacterized protein DUF1302